MMRHLRFLISGRLHFREQQEPVLMLVMAPVNVCARIVLCLCVPCEIAETPLSLFRISTVPLQFAGAAAHGSPPPWP